jgi:C-methyltransferase
MARVDRRALPAVTPPPLVLRTVSAVRRGIERVHRSSTLPLVRLLEQTVALAEVRATAVFAELGVADLLEQGAQPAGRLADQLAVDPQQLDRLLRFLATRGVVRRRGDRYALTAVSDLLREAHPDSVRDWVRFHGSAWQWHAWEPLATGLADPTTTPFELAHGASYFAHLQAEPAAGALFDAAMRATSRLQGGLLAAALDLEGVTHVCDVGGGTGTTLARLLQARPELRGTLVELPSVIERAGAVLAAEGVADRVTLVAGDMFSTVPAGADRYLLSAVVHDWPDDRAVEVLQTVRRALAGDARAIVVELALPDHDGASLERAFDLLMLVLGGGRERTPEELRVLFAAAGLSVTANTVLANGWHAYELAA